MIEISSVPIGWAILEHLKHLMQCPVDLGDKNQEQSSLLSARQAFRTFTSKCIRCADLQFPSPLSVREPDRRLQGYKLPSFQSGAVSLCYEILSEDVRLQRHQILCGAMRSSRVRSQSRAVITFFLHDTICHMPSSTDTCHTKAKVSRQLEH